jgi:hypothetical protein
VSFHAISIALLTTLGEEVIARIEERVSAGVDSDSVQRELVSDVYGIRREVEEVDRWHRHFPHNPA